MKLNKFQLLREEQEPHKLQLNEKLQIEREISNILKSHKINFKKISIDDSYETYDIWINIINPIDIMIRIDPENYNILNYDIDISQQKIKGNDPNTLALLKIAYYLMTNENVINNIKNIFNDELKKNYNSTISSGS